MHISRKKIAAWVVSALISVGIFLLTQFTFPGVLVQIAIFSIFPANQLVFILLGWVAVFVVTAWARYKHKKMTIGIVIALFMVISSLNILFWKLRDDARMARMQSLQQEIDKYFQKEGKLPDYMEEKTHFTTLSSGPFGLDNVQYFRSGQDYQLSSYNVPIGPHDVYDSKTKEWSHEE